MTPKSIFSQVVRRSRSEVRSEYGSRRDDGADGAVVRLRGGRRRRRRPGGRGPARGDDLERAARLARLGRAGILARELIVEDAAPSRFPASTAASAARATPPVTASPPRRRRARSRSVPAPTRGARRSAAGARDGECERERQQPRSRFMRGRSSWNRRAPARGTTAGKPSSRPGRRCSAGDEVPVVAVGLVLEHGARCA